jgi:two-component system LytT family response regulator
MPTVVLIDDESKSRENIKWLLNTYHPEFEVVCEGDSVKQGIKSILEFQPDVVFLDIEMQDGTGFDLLDMLPQKNFHLIFSTSHDHFAIKAFKYSAIDYLLKPIDSELLSETLQRIKNINISNQLEQKINILTDNRKTIEKIGLPSMDGIRFVRISDIIRCESDNNYTWFYLFNKEKILVSKTLKEYDDLLTEFNFFRAHKSHLVNINHIEKYINGEGGYLIMTDESSVDVSRRKKEALLNVIYKTK